MEEGPCTRVIMTDGMEITLEGLMGEWARTIGGALRDQIMLLVHDGTRQHCINPFQVVRLTCG